MQLDDIGFFCAYKNGSIRVRFLDRTVVRMTHGSQFVKVLDRRGNEHSFSLGSPAACEYQNYVKVSEEYLEWVFLAEQD